MGGASIHRMNVITVKKESRYLMCRHPNLINGGRDRIHVYAARTAGARQMGNSLSRHCALPIWSSS